jgi:hypothetical protein
LLSSGAGWRGPMWDREGAILALGERGGRLVIVA